MNSFFERSAVSFFVKRLDFLNSDMLLFMNRSPGHPCHITTWNHATPQHEIQPHHDMKSNEFPARDQTTPQHGIKPEHGMESQHFTTCDHTTLRRNTTPRYVIDMGFNSPRHGLREVVGSFVAFKTWLRIKGKKWFRIHGCEAPVSCHATALSSAGPTRAELLYCISNGESE